MENGQLNNLLDFKDEKDFITYKMKQRTRKKIISTTVKCEYKSLNNNIANKNNKTNNILNNYTNNAIPNLKSDKSSSLLRSHSRILNNMPYDDYFNKTIVKKNEVNQDKRSIPSSNKGFHNFSLSKVCGSSHPCKDKSNNQSIISVNNNINDIVKKVEVKNNNNIDNIFGGDNTDSDCKFVRSYSLNYNIKQIYEEKETNSYINNINNNYFDNFNTINNKENININNNQLLDNLQRDKNELLNNTTTKEKKIYYLLPNQ